MSWDAVIVRIRGPFRPISDVAANDYLPLGALKSVAAAVRAAFPDGEWDSPSHANRELDEHNGHDDRTQQRGDVQLNSRIRQRSGQSLAGSSLTVKREWLDCHRLLVFRVHRPCQSCE